MDEFVEYTEIWRNKWLETFEEYQTEITAPKTKDGPRDILKEYGLRELERSIRCISTYGYLEEVLDMIEAGEQGTSFKSRVQKIREDIECVGNLEEVWWDQTSIEVRAFGPHSQQNARPVWLSTQRLQAMPVPPSFVFRTTLLEDELNWPDEEDEQDFGGKFGKGSEDGEEGASDQEG
jgi:hypothetical protein